jgi:hypothetical protein
MILARTLAVSLYVRGKMGATTLRYISASACEQLMSRSIMCTASSSNTTTVGTSQGTNEHCYDGYLRPKHKATGQQR